MFLGKVKIRTKLLGGFLIVALIAVSLGIYGMITLKNTFDSDMEFNELMVSYTLYPERVSNYFIRFYHE